MRKKNAPSGIIPADHLMIIAAFRYCLGRQTYIVKHCCDWIGENWQNIGENTRAIIARDLDEAFEDDDKDRAKGATIGRLGADFDRGAWAAVRRLYRKPNCCQCGKTDLADSDIATIHRDGEASCKDCHSDQCVVCGKTIKVGETFIPVDRKGRHPGCAP